MYSVIAYFDNNIYNYLVDPARPEFQHVSALVEAAKSDKLQVLFSPVNLTEMARCFESKPEKARKMVDLSLQLADRVAVLPAEVVSAQVRAFVNGRPPDINDLWPQQPSMFDQVRTGIVGNNPYTLPDEFHASVSQFDVGYVDELKKMVVLVDALVEEAETDSTVAASAAPPPGQKVDLYAVLNKEPVQRKKMLQDVIKAWCGMEVELPANASFDSIPCLSVFLRYHLGFARELIVAGKSPKSGDWADRDQTLYFSYADFVVTSDTGGGGVFPNYREIVDKALRPMGHAAVKFSTFVAKLSQ